MLLALAMIPGWITALKLEAEIQSHFSFIFYSLEKSCDSIEKLKKTISFYNKVKFIENNQYSDKITFVHLTKNVIDNDQPELKIIFPDKNMKNRIEIAKRSLIDRDANIVIATTSKEILENILSTPIAALYCFDIGKIATPFFMVRPNIFLAITLLILSALLTALWITTKKTFSYKKNFQMKLDEFKVISSFKTAYLSFLNLTLSHLYGDLNAVFQMANYERTDQRSLLEKNITNIRQSLGRIITFGTFKHDYKKIELTQEINMAIDCLLDQTTERKINIIKANFENATYIKQTKPKNFLILLSILRHFIINLPPKTQLFITIDSTDELSVLTVFDGHFSTINDGSFQSFYRTSIPMIASTLV